MGVKGDLSANYLSGMRPLIYHHNPVICMFKTLLCAAQIGFTVLRVSGNCIGIFTIIIFCRNRSLWVSISGQGDPGLILRITRGVHQALQVGMNLRVQQSLHRVQARTHEWLSQFCGNHHVTDFPLAVYKLWSHLNVLDGRKRFWVNCVWYNHVQELLGERYWWWPSSFFTVSSCFSPCGGLRRPPMQFFYLAFCVSGFWLQKPQAGKLLMFCFWVEKSFERYTSYVCINSLVASSRALSYIYIYIYMWSFAACFINSFGAGVDIDVIFFSRLWLFIPKHEYWCSVWISFICL